MLLMLLAALAPIPSVATGVSPQTWVEMAPDGGSTIRILTSAETCPTLSVDGHRRVSTLRAAPEILPTRSNKAQVADPATFTHRVCELRLPRTAKHARLNGQALPLPAPRINRIVLIGDTGCRLKASENAWQDCQNTAQWPFAAIAARAASLHPDLVLHVGDYLYRESPCPTDQQNCANTPWGYGERGWRADFLDPAAPLLAAAPWIMVRGNHEECARAGQGWWRLLDPHALQPGNDCRDPANDPTGDHTEPFAVSLGGGAQIVVADLIELASGKHGDTAINAAVDHDLAMIARLSSEAPDTFVTAHFPFNPVLWQDKTPGSIVIGSKPIKGHDLPPLPHVRAMLAGHIHLFQYARFSDRPTQVITGFSGTMEDIPSAPATLSEAAEKHDAAPLTALTTIGEKFGYAVLLRQSHGWRLTVFSAEGEQLGEYTL